MPPPKNQTAENYTAYGPATAAFQTEGSGKDRTLPTCEFGANLKGKQIGVFADGGGVGVRGEGGDIGVHGRGFDVGVRGEGIPYAHNTIDAIGVIGRGRQGASGVLGISTRDPRSLQDPGGFDAPQVNGVEGVSDGIWGAGVLGRSIAPVEDDADLPPISDRTGAGVGVAGISRGPGVAGFSDLMMGVWGQGAIGVVGEAPHGPGKEAYILVGGDRSLSGGIGLYGLCKEGQGVFGDSDRGTGVVGFSRDGRGGVFESVHAAQLQLVPHPTDIAKPQANRPPKIARAGDLFALMVPSRVIEDQGQAFEAELWFCTRGSRRSRNGHDATWGRVKFDKFL